MSLKLSEKLAYYLAFAFAVYMPLHIFLAQSLSLATGGLDVWKAAKDIIICVAVPFLLLMAYKQGAFRNKFFKRFIVLGGLYVLLYVLFLLFDKNADIKSAITGSVYNTRPFGYLLLGYVVANSQYGPLRIKKLVKVLLIMGMVVAGFGVAQYFLPKDILTHFGYSLARGVKSMFFIDDKPDFPRVMSTLRDPNSLGAFLALPIVYSTYFLFIKKGKHAWKLFSDKWLGAMLAVSSLCLVFTFSRSGTITAFIGVAALLFIVTNNKKGIFKKYLPIGVVVLVVVGSLLLAFKNTYVVQNLVLHADKTTVQQDPNQLRISLGKQAVGHIKTYPFGEGPGTAGLVSISNPKGTLLTENYYLQIAYEVGVAGFVLFICINLLILKRLYAVRNDLSVIVLCTGVGIAVFSLLNHSWSNEALALQWWLLAGITIGINYNKKHRQVQV